jgi:hypothetical protein
MSRGLLLVTLVALASLQCGNPVSPRAVTFTCDFAAGADGWVSGFADYPAGENAFYELVADYRPLPASLGAARNGLYISGNNHSDDLFMFYKHRVAGLRARAQYEVQIDAEIATDVPTGCGGGGSPGESVFVKAGMAASEPTVASDASGSIRLVNFDKGNQGTSGRDALVLGTVANSRLCEILGGQIVRQWELKSLRAPAPLPIQTDDQGNAWILIGTESGFEGATRLYYTRVVAIVTQR